MSFDRLSSFADDVRRRVDTVQRETSWLGVIFGVVKKFSEDRAGSLAALIAYFGFFSLFPLLLLLTTVLGFLLGDDSGLRADLADSAFSQIPVIGGQIGEGSLQGSAVGLVVGLVGALWAGTAAMAAAQNAMNEVWKVEMHQRPGFVETRLRALAMLLVLGLGLVAATTVGALAGAVTNVGFVGRAGIYAGNVAVDIVVAGGSFMVLTDRRLTPRHVWPGALLAGFGYFILQLVGTEVVARRIDGATSTYGTFATVIGLLTYLYILAQLTVLAAELNTVLHDHLYPRSLDPDDATEADRRAFAAHVRSAKRSDRQEIEITATSSSTVHAESGSAEAGGSTS